MDSVACCIVVNRVRTILLIFTPSAPCHVHHTFKRDDEKEGWLKSVFGLDGFERVWILRPKQR